MDSWIIQKKHLCLNINLCPKVFFYIYNVIFIEIIYNNGLIPDYKLEVICHLIWNKYYRTTNNWKNLITSPFQWTFVMLFAIQFLFNIPLSIENILMRMFESHFWVSTTRIKYPSHFSLFFRYMIRVMFYSMEHRLFIIPFTSYIIFWNFYIFIIADRFWH